MDIEEQDVRSCAETIGYILSEDEENFAVSTSSVADTAFDTVIGCIENIIMEEEFRQVQENFMEKHYLEFEDSEENKLSYMAIFNEYVNLLEKHLEQQLMIRIPGFDMNGFVQLLMQHKEEVAGDILDILLTFTDFMAFKDMFLQYKAEKEGLGLDLSQALMVTRLFPADSKHATFTQ